MKTMFNFGDTHKDFTPVADAILGSYEITHIPITNNRLFYNEEMQIVDANYGYSQVSDSLDRMMNDLGRLSRGDEVVFLGSMGSLSSRLRLGDYVVPTHLHCACFGEEWDVLQPNPALLDRLEEQLKQDNVDYKVYQHGSVKNVFDPTTNHKEYTNSLYDTTVEGLDCAESYGAIQFCDKNKLSGVVLLYCSDDRLSHIADIPKAEFDQRALDLDLAMPRIAEKVLLK